MTLQRVIVCSALLGCVAPPRPAGSPVSTDDAGVSLARRGTASDVYFGVSVADPYRWLEDLSSPETRTWVAAQNRLVERQLAGAPERRHIRGLLSRVVAQPRFGVPFRAGDRYFFLRQDAGQNQPVLYVEPTLDGPTGVVLDVNPLANEGPVTLVDEFLSFGVSPDGRFLAYGLDRSGADWQEVRVRDLATGADLSDRVEGLRTWMWPSWTADSRGFFYTRERRSPPSAPSTAAKGDDQVLYHRLGTPQSMDIVVFDTRGRPDLQVRQRVTEDGRYLVLYHGVGNEPRHRLLLIDLKDPDHPDVRAPVSPLVDTADARYRVLGNRGAVFYVATSRDAPRGRVVAIDARDPRASRWKTVVPEGEGVISVDFFNWQVALIGGRLVIPTREGMRRRVRFYTLDGLPAGELPLPEGASVGHVWGTADREELLYDLVRFPYATTVYRYDLGTRDNLVLTAPEATLDPQQYETQLVFYPSKDGTRVPMFVTGRKGITLDGSHPVYLTGYGGFGGGASAGGYGPLAPMQNVVWLQLGGIVATASPRGDATLGEAWHRAAIREQKQNTFDDFIAAAQYLIREGYTRPARVAIGGMSNGGLLVAAVLTQRPDLFAVALPDVPPTDMLRAARLPGGDIGLSEYGAPDTPEMFRALLAYSPLHNLRSGTCYPATLVTTAMNDANVHPSHAFKFAAALQTAQSCGRPVLLLTQMDAGHGGGASVEARVDKAADLLTFMARHLGVTAIAPSP
jgi:prolyl oligopeptidase